MSKWLRKQKLNIGLRSCELRLVTIVEETGFPQNIKYTQWSANYFFYYATLRYATLRYSTLLYATLRYSTLLYATLRYSTLLHVYCELPRHIAILKVFCTI
jgi:uncharacterized protein YjbI with pentapeptide repeats